MLWAESGEETENVVLVYMKTEEGSKECARAKEEAEEKMNKFANYLQKKEREL